jgi:ethanolamine utilization protein EutQ
MPRQLFTAADIRRVAREQKSDVLVLGSGDLITPEAVDVAREMGVRVIRENSSVGAPPARAAPSTDLPPLRVVHGTNVAQESFGAGLATPGMTVQLKDVITSGDGSPMAAGYMTLESPSSGAGEFPWTLSYDEVDIVLEGELVITRQGARGAEQVRGGPGDVIFIPKGSSITFGTPSRTRFVYVAFPANWNEQG